MWKITIFDNETKTEVLSFYTRYYMKSRSTDDGELAFTDMLVLKCESEGIYHEVTEFWKDPYHFYKRGSREYKVCKPLYNYCQCPFVYMDIKRENNPLIKELWST